MVNNGRHAIALNCLCTQTFEKNTQDPNSHCESFLHNFFPAHGIQWQKRNGGSCQQHALLSLHCQETLTTCCLVPLLWLAVAETVTTQLLAAIPASALLACWCIATWTWCAARSRSLLSQSFCPSIDRLLQVPLEKRGLVNSESDWTGDPIAFDHLSVCLSVHICLLGSDKRNAPNQKGWQR